MDGFQGYNTGLFINNSKTSPSPNMFSFVMRDSIYSPFPVADIYFPDNSGLFMELGSFTQGAPLNIKFGIAGTSQMLDANFGSVCRDAPSPCGGASALNGNLEIKARHISFFDKREIPDTAFKGVSASDAVCKLFPAEPKLKTEPTKGKIEAYAFYEPYTCVKNFLLPQATNGSVSPYVFFRDLENALHFESAVSLEGRHPCERLAFGCIEGDSAYNTLYSFLPFNEKLDKTLEHFRAVNAYLKNDLSFAHDEKSVAEGVKGKIPVVADTRLRAPQYFRQFNPSVDYKHLNDAFFADAMRAGFFTDKALCSLSFHPNLVAGKTAEVAVSLSGRGAENELSETFSGKWLIEQSAHFWDGQGGRGKTELVLCRSSVIPRRDSIINGRAFSG